MAHWLLLTSDSCQFLRNLKVGWEFSKCPPKWLIHRPRTSRTQVIHEDPCKNKYYVWNLNPSCCSIHYYWCVLHELLKSQRSRLHQLIVKSAGVFRACEGPVLGFSSCQQMERRTVCLVLSMKPASWLSKKCSLEGVHGRALGLEVCVVCNL